MRLVLGTATVVLLLAVTLGSTAAVLSFPGRATALNAGDWAALRFTVMQALISATLSVVIAIPAARALARRRFIGRGVLVALLGAPFILPVIVAVLGLLAIWGRSGLASSLLVAVGLPPISIYGLTGVVLAHVFFNLPLATRLILQGWMSIPAEHFRLAANLGMGSAEVRRTLEWPMLRAVLPGTFLVIFLLCVTSFAVVLTLGGGPKATTVELAIFQALRFDFDLGKAAALALVQVALCLVAAALTLGFALRAEFSLGLDTPPRRWDGRSALARGIDWAVIGLVALFLLLPLSAVGVRGLPQLGALPPGLWQALLTTLLIAVPVALLSTALAMAMAGMLTRLSPGLARLIEGSSVLALAISPFVIGTGLFIVLNPVIDPFSMAVPVTIAINAVMALPFTLRILLPAFQRADAHYARLGASLGMGGWTLFRLALWPRLRRPAGFAAGLAGAMSVGDLGVITLFAPPDLSTLPLLMYRLMGSYQMDAAAGVALILVATALALFVAFDRGGRLDDHIR
ncbi:MAG: thiamine/thiamine pyrophosphate ABC transporter permease ThiP [Pseudomonadota bacterium]